MRLMLEDDGTIEIIEVKIVRVRGRDGQALKSAQTQTNNINTGKSLSVVRMGSAVVLSVAQLAVLLAGLVHYL